VRRAVITNIHALSNPRRWLQRPPPSKTDLKGKVAVITGRASGVGLAPALRAAQEGMKAALADADDTVRNGDCDVVLARREAQN